MDNFILQDLSNLIRKHRIFTQTTPNRYSSKVDVFTWKTNDLIDKLALYNLLDRELDFRRENIPTDVPGNEVKPRTPQMPSARRDIQEKVGMVSAIQLGEMLGKSSVTVRNWAKKSKTPHTLIRGKYYFKKDVVKQWMDERMSA